MGKDIVGYHDLSQTEKAHIEELLSQLEESINRENLKHAEHACKVY
jgi:hypothetical protein